MHLICGEALYDVFLDGKEEQAGGEILLKAVPGGSPFNVAIGMARLGGKVALASDLARDALGDRLAAHLAMEGVSDRFLRRAAFTTALAIVSTDDAGTPSYSFSGLEQAIYCPAVAALGAAPGAISGIHLGSIAIVLPNSARSLRELARGNADQALISLDPNVRLSIVPETAAWQRAIEEIRPFCQVVKISEEDIAALYGAADADAVCRGWLTDRTALVVLTRGGEGASMFTRALGRVDIPPARTLVVDTVGAGDSFMAALLSGLRGKGWTTSPAIAALDAQQILEIGSFAAYAAGVTCSRRGPMLPSMQELDALRRSSPAGG